MILRVILITLVALLVIRGIRLIIAGIMDGASPEQRRGPSRAVKLVRDPVCGTHVAPQTAVSLTSKRGTYYFCSKECRAKFRAR